MAGPETRLVNRCTYAERHPDIGTEEGKSEAAALGKLRHPFVKLSVLTTAIDRPELLEQVLGDGSGTDPQAPVLRQAIEAVWAGDLPKAAQLVSGVDIQQVTAFASACVSREQSLWITAQAALDRAISKQAAAAVGSAAAEQPSGAVTPEPSEAANTGLTETDVARAIMETRDQTAGQAAAMTPAAARQALSRPELVLREGSVSASVLGAVEPSAVQAQLAESAPKVARFLAGTGYFSLPRPTLDAAVAETARMIAFTELQKYLAAQKQAAIQSLSVLGVTSPIGYLHLERLAFTPVGYERGDLAYSLPMLPNETVRLTHSEWSKTSQEFSQLVATSLETAKQDAVAQTSELTEAVTAQQQHSSAFSSSTTASGGFGPVHISETVSANANDSAGRTAQSSAKHSQEITRQASSRSKEEHKITFNVSTSYEVADQSFREFTNPSDQPVRWDFYRLMKKWQIDLYRYDIRLTYDIIVPEPASYLLRHYIELAQLKTDLERGFKLTLSPTGITRHTWQDLSNQYDVALDPPPLIPPKAPPRPR